MENNTIQYPPTWYAYSKTQFPVQPTLGENIKADVCIVGGGLAGLSIAWQLCQSGVTVAVLEAKRIAWGASGRNGGFVSPGFAGDIDRVENVSGKEVAQRLYQYSVLGSETIRTHIKDFAPHCLMGEGKYSVSRYAAAESMRRTAGRLTEDFNDPVEYLDASAMRSRINTDRYFQGIYKPRGFQIHPLNYAIALAEKIVDCGGRIFENTPAVSMEINSNSGMHNVTTLSSMVEAEHVVLCTSAYDNGLYEPLHKSVLPVSTHVVVSEPLRPEQVETVRTRCGIADTGNACDYYRLIEGNRLLWGGKITTARTQPAKLDQKMLAAITDVFPAFSDLKIDYRWSGLMGYCRHKMPLIQQPKDRLWIATAFGGHGLNTTAMAGSLVASAITEEDSRWRDFSDYDLLWNGGILGQAAVQLSYWWMQAKDSFLESRARNFGN